MLKAGEVRRVGLRRDSSAPRGTPGTGSRENQRGSLRVAREWTRTAEMWRESAYSWENAAEGPPFWANRSPGTALVRADKGRVGLQAQREGAAAKPPACSVAGSSGTERPSRPGPTPSRERVPELEPALESGQRDRSGLGGWRYEKQGIH